MIILVRHATPQVEYGYCDYQRARTLIKEYDIVPTVAVNEVHDFMQTSDYNLIKDVIPAKIYCSPLIRAKLTCEALFKDVSYEPDDLFKEAENEIGRLPFIRLKLRRWFLINRIRWLLGLHSSRIENLKNFKVRVDSAYNKVMRERPEENTVAVVAHGVFLHQFRTLMKKHQPRWIETLTFKKGCFTITVYKHISEFK